MEITKREIIFSVIIACAMIGLGIFIHGKIGNSIRDKNERYYKAIELESDEMFQYGLDTNVGDSFTYGELKAVDTVSMDGFGPYMLISRELEEYTKHTKTVEDSDGNKHTETYWTWDHVHTDTIHSQVLNFCGVDFDYEKFSEISYYTRHFKFDVPCGYHKRYQYYELDTSYMGTLFADLDEHTVNDTRFMKDVTLDKALDYYVESPTAVLVLFWILWVVFTGALVFGFCYLDNKWLED